MADENVLVSLDDALRRPFAVLTENDRELLRAVREDSDAVEVGPPIVGSDGVERKFVAPSVVWTELKWFQQYGRLKPDLDLVTARLLRDLRVRRGYSWRAVARWAHEQQNGEWSPRDNQIAGMDLCEAAAKLFNEDFLAPPWNQPPPDDVAEVIRRFNEGPPPIF